MTGALNGKVAVVTGSTQGLGAAVAELFVRAGAKVVLSGRSVENGERVRARLGSSAVFVQTDLASVVDCGSLIDAALRHFDGIDILVNSAADTSRSTLDDVTPEFFDRQMAVNVRAPLLLARRAADSLRRRGGVVINVGSVNAAMGEPSLLVYSATKGALQTASRNLANALKFDRVRVYCLNVGWMDTEGERTVLAREGLPPDFIARQGAQWPLGRPLRPTEVAEVCLFLASDRAAPFSGTVIELEQFPTGPLAAPVHKGPTSKT
jgi:NAD(P)-dependent dehydrogenase (short-subunit alcohol dehydrogenase family)